MHKKSGMKVPEFHRRSERVLLRIPIEVSGVGTDRSPFQEKTHTLVINRHGARISLKSPVKKGDEITITDLKSEKSLQFRVVERAGGSLGEGPEWGVECVKPDTHLWGVFFPEKAATPSEQDRIDALLECTKCKSREMARLTAAQFKTIATHSILRRQCLQCGTLTEWRFGFVEEEGSEPIPVQPETPAPTHKGGGPERRRDKRVAAKLPLRVRVEDGDEEITRTENISKSGACFASELAMKQGDRVFLTIGYTPEINMPEMAARVLWVRDMGEKEKDFYGVRFDEVFAELRSQIEK